MKKEQKNESPVLNSQKQKKYINCDQIFHIKCISSSHSLNKQLHVKAKEKVASLKIGVL